MEGVPTEFDPVRDKAPLRPDTREGMALRGTRDGVAEWIQYCDEYGLDATDHVAFRQWMNERETPVGWR